MAGLILLCVQLPSIVRGQPAKDDSVCIAAAHTRRPKRAASATCDGRRLLLPASSPQRGSLCGCSQGQHHQVCWLRGRMSLLQLSRHHASPDQLLPSCLHYATRRPSRPTSPQLPALRNTQACQQAPGSPGPWPCWYAVYVTWLHHAPWRRFSAPRCAFITHAAIRRHMLVFASTANPHIPTLLSV